MGISERIPTSEVNQNGLGGLVRWMSLQCSSPCAVGASVQSHLKGLLLLRGFSYQTASLKVTHHPYFPWGGVNDWRRKLLPVLYLSFPPQSPLLAVFQLFIQNSDMCVLWVGLLEYIIRCNRTLVCTSGLERARMSNFQILGLYKLFFLASSILLFGGELSTSSTLSRFLWFLF